MCHSQICLLWRSTGVSGLAHRLEPKAIFLQAPQSSERVHGQATGGPHGLPSFPSQRHTEDPILDISAPEPKMSCLSTLCGKHRHPPPHPRPHPPQKHTPRCDETGKQWSGKQKGINIPPAQSQLQRQHVAGEAPASTGEVTKSSLDRLRAEGRLHYGGAAFPALEPAGNASTQSPPD